VVIFVCIEIQLPIVLWYSYDYNIIFKKKKSKLNLNSVEPVKISGCAPVQIIKNFIWSQYVECNIQIVSAACFGRFNS
jgi:hypothetical protein